MRWEGVLILLLTLFSTYGFSFILAGCKLFSPAFYPGRRCLTPGGAGECVPGSRLAGWQPDVVGSALAGLQVFESRFGLTGIPRTIVLGRVPEHRIENNVIVAVTHRRR